MTHDQPTKEPPPDGRLSRDETGASAVEYGLLIAGIAALIALIVFTFGGAVGGLFSDTCTQVQTQRSTTGC